MPDNSLHILLIDDNPDDRALVLRELGRSFPRLSVKQITDVRQFHAALKEGNFQLAIIDYRVHWNNGLNITRAIKLRFPTCPVIMFTTASGNEEVAVQAMKAGLDDYIIKSPRHLIRLTTSVKLMLDHHRQRQAVQEAEARYRTLFDGVPVGLYRMGCDGQFLDVNEALVQMLAYPDRATLLLGNMEHLWVDRSERGRWQEQLQEMGTVLGYEMRLRCFDGKEIWVSHHTRAVRADDGSILYYEGSVENITRRRKTEEEYAYLLERERMARAEAEAANERLRHLQTISDAMLRHLGPEEMFQEVLSHIREILKVDWASVLLLDASGEALQERSAVGLTAWKQPPLPIPIGEGCAGQVVAQHRPVAVKETNITGLYDALLHRSGICSIAGAPLLAADGQVAGVVQVGTRQPRHFGEEDLLLLQLVCDRIALAIRQSESYEAERTARKEAEKAQQRLTFLSAASSFLAASLDYETALVNVARLAIPEVADWCTVYTLNEEEEIIPLVSVHADPVKEEWVGQLNQQYPPVSNESFGVQMAMSRGQSQFFPRILEEVLVTPANDEVHLDLLRRIGPRSVIVVPLLVRERVMGAIFFALTDTEREYTVEDLNLAEELARRTSLAIDRTLLYRQATEAVQTRDQFLSIAAHELKTPITTILGYARLLQRRGLKELQDDSHHRALHIIADQAIRLNRLVVSLLDISHIQGNGLALQNRPVALVSLVQRLTEEMQPALENHTLSLISCDDDIQIEGDELRLEQVIWNLLQNAVKYSPDGGEVQVKVEHRDDWIYLSITDAGIGIPEEAIPQLFSRFYRGSNVDTHQIAGMGLGLYVVKEIVNLHRGRITVQSREGEGSTFIVSLPIWRP